MSGDPFAGKSLAVIHNWYLRLALKQTEFAGNAGVAKPMAGPFLIHYLGKSGLPLGSDFPIRWPLHLQTSPSVTSVLAFHRQVFLTEKKGIFGSKIERWAGLIPRLQDKRWDGVSAIQIDYQSLSDIAPTLAAINALRKRNNPVELDIFTSLRGWQLKSTVKVTGQKTGDGLVLVRFQSWFAEGFDTYDFSKVEGLTLPNPDFGSKDKNAIAPEQARSPDVPQESSKIAGKQYGQTLSRHDNAPMAHHEPETSGTGNY